MRYLITKMLEVNSAYGFRDQKSLDGLEKSFNIFFVHIKMSLVRMSMNKESMKCVQIISRV